MSDVPLPQDAPVPPRWVWVALWAVCTLALAPLFYSAQWAGKEVARYQVSTFEEEARLALAERRFADAIKYCDGAIKTGHNRSEHWGRVYTLRALAHLGAEDLNKSLAQILLAGDFFTRRYYFAEQQDRAEAPHLAEAIGRKLLEGGNADDALRAFSAGAMMSGAPAAWLNGLQRRLNEMERAQLWPEGRPMIIVKEFRDPTEDPLSLVVNAQARPVQARVLDTTLPETAAQIQVGASTESGSALFAFDTHIPIQGPGYALRARSKTSSGDAPKLFLGYWFDAAQKSASTEDAPTESDADGWNLFDVRRNFARERAEEATANGYLPSGGIINKVGLSLPPGPEATYWLGRVELYLPG